MKTKTLLSRSWLILLLLLAAGVYCYGQELTLVGSVPVNKPGVVSLDRLGQVYVADQKNNLHKFDPQGKLLFTYSPTVQGHLALVEAWNPVKTLLFYDDRQQITLLDRFLTPISTLRLNSLSDGVIRLATLSNDDQVWVLDESNFSLSKVDARYPDARSEAKLNQVFTRDRYDFRFLREYQNNLYLLDRLSGIYLFDNMGNYRKQLPVKDLTQIGFRRDELYYLQNRQVHFVHLYNLKGRLVDLPPGKEYGQVLAGDTFLYLFHAGGFDIYTLPR